MSSRPRFASNQPSVHELGVKMRVPHLFRPSVGTTKTWAPPFAMIGPKRPRPLEKGTIILRLYKMSNGTTKWHQGTVVGFGVLPDQYSIKYSEENATTIELLPFIKKGKVWKIVSAPNTTKKRVTPPSPSVTSSHSEQAGKQVWYYWEGDDAFHENGIYKVNQRNEWVGIADGKHLIPTKILHQNPSKTRVREPGAWGYKVSPSSRPKRAPKPRAMFEASHASRSEHRMGGGTMVQIFLKRDHEESIWVAATILHERKQRLPPNVYNVYSRYDNITHLRYLRESERGKQWDLLNDGNPLRGAEIEPCKTCSEEDSPPALGSQATEPKYIKDMQKNPAVTHVASLIRATPYFQLVQRDGATGDYQKALTKDPIDPIKMFINMYLAKAIQHFVDDPRQRAAVVLDAEYLLSSWTLHFMGGIDLDKITIPNGYYKNGYFHTSAPEMKDWASNTETNVNIFENTSQELLGAYWGRDWKPNPIPTLFYLDYCGCFESFAGTAGPGMDDVHSILSKMPTDCVFIIGVTSAMMRCLKDIKKRIGDFIEEVANETGHTLRCKEVFQYRRKSNMVFEAFVFNADERAILNWNQLKTTQGSSCFPTTECEKADGDPTKQLHTSF